VIRTNPPLVCCLKRCRHCRIFFLTHPCNAGRNDLRCPFGCRKTHRKRASASRAASYYRKHPDEKRRHNRNRYLSEAKDERGIEEEKQGLVEEWSRPIIKHVRMVVSLIEGRRVSLDEVVGMVKRISRQHSLTRWRRMDYVVSQLNKGPPGG
jgi:hypothetical protein